MGSSELFEQLVEEIRSLSPDRRSEVRDFVQRLSQRSEKAEWGTFALEQWEPGSEEETTYTLEDARKVFHTRS